MVRCLRCLLSRSAKRWLTLAMFVAFMLTIALMISHSEEVHGEELPTSPLPRSLELPPLAPDGDFVMKRLDLRRRYSSQHPILLPSLRLVEFYKLQIPQRRAYLDTVASSLSKNYMFLYNNLAPEVYCPELMRVGTTNDGGKWICSPFRIPSRCNIISLGMYNEITFEQELQHITNKRCKLYAYDMNEQAPQTIANLRTIKAIARMATIAAASDESRNEYTIDDLMNIEGITDFEILKIDIEGSEFQVIPPLLQRHKPAQVLIEIHGSPADTVSLLRKISSQGYWLYSYEINGAWHHLCEFSFIHKSAFKRYGVTPVARYLD